MTTVWVVRAEHGKYADHFICGGYLGGGWLPEDNLSEIKDRREIDKIYRQRNPDLSNPVVGSYVGQTTIFLLDIKAGDYVITPRADRKWLNFCRIEEDPSYYYSPDVSDGCPFPHRRRAAWDERRLRRSEFSFPFQYTLRAAKTAFRISNGEEFLTKIGVSDSGSKPPPPPHDPYKIVLEQILNLSAKEFEILVGELLAALGFDDPEVTGKPGDGGVDVKGVLNVSNLANVELFVQAKRYKSNQVGASDVHKLRETISQSGQGAFITTSDYQSKAHEAAEGFPRIGLINGHQLVDLLIEHWGAISEEFREQLGLKPGLILV